jgi:hypothetical protein
VTPFCSRGAATDVSPGWSERSEAQPRVATANDNQAPEGRQTQEMTVDIFSYVITCDRGFAPNPFGGFLTLATCKPRIRRAAREDDLIIATGSVSTQYKRKLIYAAVVSKVVPWEEYGSSADYKIKRPSTKGKWWRKHGDNIYAKVNKKWKRRRNESHTTRETMIHDLRGKNVLVCNRFWYFGADAKVIPANLRKVIQKGRGHKRIEDGVLVQEFLKWLNREYAAGCRGTPALSPKPTNRCDKNEGC